MDSATVGTMFASMTTTITSILTTNLPLVLGVVAGLIGLGFLIRFVKRHIGHKA